jgi:hypothetical protein
LEKEKTKPALRNEEEWTDLRIKHESLRHNDNTEEEKPKRILEEQSCGPYPEH